MPARTVIVLKARAPPVRAEKILFYQNRRFTCRQSPASVPALPPSSSTDAPVAVSHAATNPAPEPSDMDYDATVSSFSTEGCPPPDPAASEQDVADWLDRMLDAATAADRSDGAER